MLWVLQVAIPTYAGGALSSLPHLRLVHRAEWEALMYYWDMFFGTYMLVLSAPGVPGSRYLKALYLLLGCWSIAAAGM